MQANPTQYKPTHSNPSQSKPIQGNPRHSKVIQSFYAVGIGGHHEAIMHAGKKQTKKTIMPLIVYHHPKGKEDSYIRIRE